MEQCAIVRRSRSQAVRLPIRAEFAETGPASGPSGPMVAGHARSRGPVIVTHNLRESGRMA